MGIGIGMDTGGTYTDAVIMDLDSGRVLSKAKSRTTHEDLTRGIAGALDGLERDLLGSVGIVALSSTLATNSVVEGKGSRVGLVCIGGRYDQSVRADYQVYVAGGHNVHGDEDTPLDVSAAEDFLRSIAGKVDGVAISGYLAVRNPDHENRVKALARDILDVPVVCGHELSTELGFSERTTTCVMNARLIPVIDELIRSVRSVLDARGIKAPLMISRGDGTMMLDSVARDRPVETILSGPAASLMGAMHMSGVMDAVVMDMGGTTTDIGILRDGRPGVDPDGAVIGGKRTRVNAARIFTYGIGGDSRIIVNPGTVIVCTERVIPLCVAASRWPNVAENLSRLARFGYGKMRRPFNNPEVQILESEMFIAERNPPVSLSLTKGERDMLELIAERPLTIESIRNTVHAQPGEIDVGKLVENRLVQRIGMTPTDILHADGTYREFDHQASLDGAAFMAIRSGMSTEEFISRARDAIRDKLCIDLMDVLLNEDSGEPDLGRTGNDLVWKFITGRKSKDFTCSFRLDKPIIGIGAPSGVYMRWVGEVFGADVIINDDSDVGNAVGVVSSSVSESLKYHIRPIVPSSEKRYAAFSKFGREWFDSIEEAVEVCVPRAREYVTQAAKASNADVVDVTVDLRRRPFDYFPGIGMLEEAELVVTAAGKPKLLL